MIAQPILETDRLILRPFRLRDAKQVQKLAGDKQIASTTLLIPHPYPDGAAEEWIDSHKDKHESGKGAYFAITLKKNGELVGAMNLLGIVESERGEIAYWVGFPYWNNGYCTEAGKAVLQYGFLNRGLNRIHARYFSRNLASGRVLEKLGMVHEGTQRQHVMKWGVYEDMELMGILRAEWEI